jgi:hypothetical protein
MYGPQISVRGTIGLSDAKGVIGGSMPVVDHSLAADEALDIIDGALRVHSRLRGKKCMSDTIGSHCSYHWHQDSVRMRAISVHAGLQATSFALL